MAVEGKRAARDGAGRGPYKGVMVWVCVLIVVMVTQIYICVKIHRPIHCPPIQKSILLIDLKKNPKNNSLYKYLTPTSHYYNKTPSWPASLLVTQDCATMQLLPTL